MDNVVLLIITGFIAGILVGTGILFVKKIVAKRNVPEIEHYKTSFTFSGNLKQTPLLDAIQFLEIGRREGILHVYCGRRKGYLVFKAGQVADAFYRNETGKEAALTLLDLDEGDFYFEAETINQPRLINESVMDLAFEWDARKNSGVQ
jgi:hypothetical protein